MAEKTSRKIGPEDLKTLARTLSFSGDAAELPKLLPSLTLLVCSPGTVLIREGEIGADIFVLLKGKVAIRRSRWIFFSREVAQLKAGDFFGEIGFLVPTVRSASVTAAEACEVFRIVSDDLKGLVERHPEIREGLEEAARQRLYALSAGT